MQAMTSVGRYIGQHIERRRAEEAVRRGEAVRGAVLESAIDSVITMNHEGRVVEFNPAAEQTFGYRRSDAVGKLVRELIVPAAPARRRTSVGSSATSPPARARWSGSDPR